MPDSKDSYKTNLKIQKWKKEGRGQGFGPNYKPWITIRDVSSDGRSHRIYGHKSQRTYHLLSDLELAAFLLLEWNPSTTDIREQYPLDLDQTIEIAEEAQIPHPKIRQNYHIVTSDFVVDTDKVETPRFVVQVKYSNALNDSRTIEKLEIERRYWAKQNIPFYIFTEHQVPKVIYENIMWLYPALKQEEISIDILERLDFYVDIFQRYKAKKVIDITKIIDTQYELEIGQSLREVRELIALRYFNFDLNIPFRSLLVEQIKLGKRDFWNEVLHASNQ